MKSLSRQKILLGVLGIMVIVAAFYYSNLWKSSDVLVAMTSTETTVVGEDVLILVNRLKSVTIDPTIFQDSLFSSLTDQSIAIFPENIARPNPFAPIGLDSGVVQASDRITSANR